VSVWVKLKRFLLIESPFRDDFPKLTPSKIRDHRGGSY
jgi:hypothetical protein